jgi:hypothetical protein
MGRLVAMAVWGGKKGYMTDFCQRGVPGWMGRGLCNGVLGRGAVFTDIAGYYH